MLTAESVYQIAKELSDKELLQLHKKITQDVKIYHTFKRPKNKNAMIVSENEIRRRVLTDIFNVKI